MCAEWKFIIHASVLGFFSMFGTLNCSRLDGNELPIDANPPAEIEKLEKLHLEVQAQ